MASKKHEPPIGEEPETKKAKLVVSDSTEPQTKLRVVLNPADCNLDFNIEEKGLQGHALHEQGFAYCWSGARANVGIRGGKYCFGCKIVSAQQVEMEDTPSDQRHVCRVGVSRADDSVGNLGETEHSFGYGGTGKFSNAGKFSNYGEKFEVGDTIVCAVNLESKPLASVGFFKNGKWLGIAKEFDATQWESALFPHVLLKNVVVQVQFSVDDGLVPEEGHKPWECAFEDGNAILGPVFSDTKDCEVLMMVGLPASGKTTWAEKWVKEHPEKRYILLGTNMALDQMKVPGLLRKQNYGERFDRLMDQATGIFNTLLARAAKTPRNFIIDQTNVYKSARKRKLKPFYLYQKIGVVVFPEPVELKLRAEKRFREMGKEVPAEAVNEMLANYVLPTSKDMPGADEFFDQVMFPELNRGEAQRHLEEMKLALRSASNSNLKSGVSPYSRESSIHSLASTLPPNQEATPATAGQWKSSSSLHTPPYDHSRPQQVSSTYSGVRLHEAPEYYSKGYQSQPVSSHYPNYDGHDGYQRPDFKINTTIPVGGTQPYKSYQDLDSYGRTDFESRNPLPAGGINPYLRHVDATPYDGPNYESRGLTPGGSTDPRWRHGGGDPYNRPNFERSTSIGSNFESPRIPLSYSNTGRHGGGDPYNRPNFEHSTSLGSNFGSLRTPLSYSNTGRHLMDSGNPRSAQVLQELAFEPHVPMSTYYSQPYRTPPPRLPYSDYRASGMQDFARMPPPGPRYY